MHHPAITDEERRARIDERNALIALQEILQSKSGKAFFKYLVRELKIHDLPVMGIEGADLHDVLGGLRVGQYIFSLLSRADHSIAANILATLEKEKYEKLIQDALNEA